MMVWLALGDFAIQKLFPPQGGGVGVAKFARYFDYGRSTEGKLSTLVDPRGSDLDDPIIKAGWLEPTVWASLPTQPEQGDELLVAGYGMSFNNQLCEAAADLHGKMTLRLIAGPAAPPSHSYRAWELDEAGGEADVAVFGVLASSVKRMRNLSGLTWTYEHPAPFTYPIYRLEHDGLERIDPLIRTETDFREAFLERNLKWHRFSVQMRRHDDSFRSAIFFGSPADQSAIVRLTRRAYAVKVDEKAERGLRLPKAGFDPASEEMQVLARLIGAFAEGSRARGQLPVVALYEDRGYHGQLKRALEQPLAESSVSVLASSDWIAEGDLTAFVGDGHFTPEVNHLLAGRLLEIIEQDGRDVLADVGE